MCVPSFVFSLFFLGCLHLGIFSYATVLLVVVAAAEHVSPETNLHLLQIAPGSLPSSDVGIPIPLMREDEGNSVVVQESSPRDTIPSPHSHPRRKSPSTHRATTAHTTKAPHAPNI